MNNRILKLAIPNILSNISVPLLSTVDVALMGRFSVIHLGAIGLGAMIFNFFFWNFGFLRMGTTGLVAQAYGADDDRTIRQILSKSIYISIFIALLLILFQFPIGQFSMWVLGVTSEHGSLVWQYFNVRIWSAPATMLTYSLFGWYFGMQNAIVPMVATIATNLINILISYLLVIHFEFGIKGVAYGTVIAEYIGLFILLVILLRSYKFRLVPLRIINNWSRFLVINGDLFIRTVALTTAFLFFYRQSSLSGGLILATNVVLLQFLSWMSYGIDGFAYASESLIGRYYGNQQRKEILSVIRLSFIWGFALAFFFSLSFGIFGQNIAGLFTEEAAVLFLVSTYKLWLWALPFVAFGSYIWDGVYIGLTKTKYMRNSMLQSLFIYLVLFSLIRGSVENAIWLSFLAFLLVRAIFLTYFWIVEIRHILPYSSNK